MLTKEELPSPIRPHIFELYDSELFQEMPRESEVASSSNRCHDEQYSYFSYPTHHDHLSNTTTHDMNNYNSTASNNDVEPAITATGISNPSMLSEDQIDGISASIDFTTPCSSFSVPQQYQYLDEAQEPFTTASIHNQISFEDMEEGVLTYAACSDQQQPMVPGWMVPHPLSTTGFEEECLSRVSSHINLRNSFPGNNCSIIDPLMGPYLPVSSASMRAPFPAHSSAGIFDFSPHQEQGFHVGVDNGGLNPPDSRVLNCSTGDLQALSSESQHVVHRSPSTTLTSDMSNFEDPKVGKLSAEERKWKIDRYLKKRNQRNFTKKIKYVCRKTLADSRPRVRGRFAKSDEMGEVARTTCSSDHQYISIFSKPTPPNNQRHKAMKEEDLNPSGIFARIGGVNSLNCNYPVQSWI